jgi:hypothetical protein
VLQVDLAVEILDRNTPYPYIHACITCTFSRSNSV